MATTKRKKFPVKLTDDEWNLLVKWVEWGGFYTWCDFRCTKDGTKDYVYDWDNHKRISLHSALNDLCEGMYIDKKGWKVTKKQVKIWNDLLDKFNLSEYKI